MLLRESRVTLGRLVYVPEAEAAEADQVSTPFTIRDCYCSRALYDQLSFDLQKNFLFSGGPSCVESRLQ